MVKIARNGIITMNAGDYLKYPLFINGGNATQPAQYILEGEDKVLFSVMEPNTPFEFGIIRKVYTKDDLDPFGNIKIILEDYDTANILPGTYYYEVKLVIRRDNKDFISTVVPRKKFYIL